MKAFEVERWNKSIHQVNQFPDTLSMYNGVNNSSNYMGPDTVSKDDKHILYLPASYIAYNDDNSMFLQFRSDGKNTFSGFQARFIRHGKMEELFLLFPFVA